MQTTKQQLREKVMKSMMVSCDVGSEYHYALMSHPDGRRKSKPFKFSNDREGFEILYKKIQEKNKIWKLPNITFGMEATGNYSDGIAHFLINKGIEVVLVNGFYTKRLKELPDNSPLKSDMKDPVVISDIMRLGYVMKYWKPEGPAAELRYLNQFRVKVMKKRIASLNQVQNALILVFPEFIKAINGIQSKTAAYLISEGYHDPQKVINCDREELIANVQKVSRRKKKAVELVDRLIAVAKLSTGIIEGKSCILEEIKWNHAQITEIDKKLEEIELKMKEQCDLIPWSKFLFSVKGFGTVIVSGLIGEIGDFSRFNDIKEIEKFAGLNLYEVSSGKHKGTRRISKRGRGYLRHILYIAALSQIRNDPTIKAWYKTMKSKGKHSFSALIAVARKALRMSYGLVKHEVDYDPQVVADSKIDLQKMADKVA